MPTKLMKQKKGGKIALSFASPEKEKYYYFIYDVITWEKNLKRSSTYYSHTHTVSHTHTHTHTQCDTHKRTSPSMI